MKLMASSCLKRSSTSGNSPFAMLIQAGVDTSKFFPITSIIPVFRLKAGYKKKRGQHESRLQQHW